MSARWRKERPSRSQVRPSLESCARRACNAGTESPGGACAAAPANRPAQAAHKAALERESLAQIGQRHGVHPVVVSQWKKQLLDRAGDAFRREGATTEAERMHDELLKKIGELAVERDFLARGLRRSR